MECLLKENFVHKDYLNQLTCSIGLGVFNDPVALPCQHVYCRCCIECWLKKNGTCPRCREKYDESQLKPQWIFAAIIQKAQVVCLNKCAWTGPYENLKMHSLVECPETVMKCSLGCQVTFKRLDQAKHKGECVCRMVDCKFCKAKIKFKDMKEHEINCPANFTPCPKGCGQKIAPLFLESHLKDECVKSSIRCRYNKTALCTFTGTVEELAVHYSTKQEEHLMLLVKAVSKLQEKITLFSKSKREIPPRDLLYTPTDRGGGLQYITDVAWKNGTKSIIGTSEHSWSVFWTNKTIATSFRARVKVNKINNDDGNSWKVCLGVVNSPQMQEGSWGKYKNAWGYIMGNGNKAFTSTEAYGAPYSLGDVITIEYKDKNVTFYKNSSSQGIAYKNVHGPLYLCVALSDKGHGVEIMDIVTEN